MKNGSRVKVSSESSANIFRKARSSGTLCKTRGKRVKLSSPAFEEIALIKVKLEAASSLPFLVHLEGHQWRR